MKSSISVSENETLCHKLPWKMSLLFWDTDVWCRIFIDCEYGLARQTNTIYQWDASHINVELGKEEGMDVE